MTFRIGNLAATSRGEIVLEPVLKGRLSVTHRHSVAARKHGCRDGGVDANQTADKLSRLSQLIPFPDTPVPGATSTVSSSQCSYPNPAS